MAAAAVVGSVPTVSSSLARNVSLPPLEYKSVADVAAKFFQERVKEVVKVFGYTAGWVAYFNPDNVPAQSLSGSAKNVKNLLELSEVPEKVNKVAGRLQEFCADPSFGAARNILADGTALINSTCDGVDFSGLWGFWSSDTLKTVSVIRNVSTVLGQGNDTIKQVQTVVGSEGKPEGTVPLALINMARAVSYVFVGALGIASTVFGAAVAPWAFLACLTSGVTFTIGGYFYERIVDPDMKYYDKDKRVAQLQAQLLSARA